MKENLKQTGNDETKADGKVQEFILLNWSTQLLTKESILLPEDFLISFNIIIVVARA